MAAAQSQKRLKTEKAARPGLQAALYYHDEARSGSHSSGLAFSTSAEKQFSCLKTVNHSDTCPGPSGRRGAAAAGPSPGLPRRLGR